MADRVAIIDHGKIVALGTPDELKRGLGQEVVELAFEEASVAGRAADALADVAPQCRLSDNGVRCYFPQAAHELPQIVRASTRPRCPCAASRSTSRPSTTSSCARRGRPWRTPLSTPRKKPRRTPPGDTDTPA